MGLGVFLRKTFEGDRKLLPGHSQTEKEKSEKLAIFAARLTDMKVDTERKKSRVREESAKADDEPVLPKKGRKCLSLSSMH